MIDDEFFDATPELQTIRQWAHARFAAKWAVFLAVLGRVLASTGPGVQLPGVIGGPASLNMIMAFVAPSGGGKGITDRVAREIWPSSIIERPIGSGEGIAALFAPPKKEGTEQITRAILHSPEIDTMAGLASRQGNIFLAQLKSAVMGEMLGQSNASDATSRIVLPHSYRLILSVGAQPGHCDVIFNDTSGGTPQRVVWVLTIDPDMPSEAPPDPEPLNTRLPSWAHTDTVMTYGPTEIREHIITAHLARQRGEASALDGHRMLTRLKVAAGLAILHHRSVISDLDWRLSDMVMAVSDQTRDWIVEEAKQAARAKVRERAISRATFDEVIDDRHEKTVRSRILRLLTTGPKSRSELRRAMGKQHYREAFDAVLPHLEKVSQVIVIAGEKAPHYKLNPEFTGEPEFTPENTSSEGVNQEFTGEPEATVTDLDTRRSHDSDPTKLTCSQWFNQYIAELRVAGQTTTTSFAAVEAGMAIGFTKGNIRAAASAHPDVHTINRKGGTATWSIEPGKRPPAYQGAPQWLDEWLDRQTTDTVDPDDAKLAGEAAGHPWHSVRRAAGMSNRIESIPAHGDSRKDRIWRIASPSAHSTDDGYSA
ncbi:hypothetical protein [Mycolicibacterium frederiksbergense]|uniref:DUF3987 domain-containing protein n=1 Tax=Mycolicibacterium frederiksbergense TaxID=117567 RepID=A0A6H0S9E1_9MYCO|nr:hypothetical protein [Mycolicibacterium frederiksbergense]QIV83049.1 hypothetical protein EXE63_20745 [Mycolicibacterium frederiksbergense]